ncbi:MAG: ABC transporter transmembrane domain-containing protein, partial [Chloroflexi bacterium]|nr:ABC transporter transmembrane domain-containing protein [Chloroflexota bacterium]
MYLRITRMALRYRWRLTIGLAAIFLASGFQLAIPILIGNAVDIANNLIGDADARARDALVATAILLFVASVGRGLAAMIQNYMGESVGQRIGYELRMLYYEKLQRLSFSYHAGVH